MLMIFRSCARKEYRDQVVKMLRGLDGEATRTAYRLDWVSESAIAELESGGVDALGWVVDPDGREALPVRTMTVDRYTIDRDAQLLDISFILGPFIQIPDNFQTDLSSWNADGERPPGCFVGSVDQPNLASAESWTLTWRRAIDFLVSRWDFSRTLFLRPIDYAKKAPSRAPEATRSAFAVERGGPVAACPQMHRLEISVLSYNPHLSTDELGTYSFRLAVSDVSHQVAAMPAVPQDGAASLEVLFLGSGEALIGIETVPRPQFSTYIPVTVRVDRDPELPPTGLIVDGYAWKSLLGGLSDFFRDDHQREEAVLKMLRTSMGDEPTLLRRLGEIAYSRGEFAAASSWFLKSLSCRTDSQTSIWLVRAALRRGAIGESGEHLEQLNTSDRGTISNLADRLMDVEWQPLIEFVGLVPHALSDRNTTTILERVLRRADSDGREDAAVAILTALSESQGALAFRHARALIGSHLDWIELRRWVVDKAIELGESLLVEDDIEALLVWRGGDPHEMLQRAQAYASLVDPGRAVPLLVESSRKMLLGTAVDWPAGLSLALSAAKLAVSSGQFALAQEALQMVHVNASPDDPAMMGFWGEMISIAGPMAAAAADLVGVQPNEELKDLVDIVNDLLKQREEAFRLVFVEGDETTGSIFSELANDIHGLSTVRLPVGSDDLGGPETYDAVLVPWGVDAGRRPELRRMLEDATVVRVLPSRASILQAIRSELAVNRREPPLTVRQAVELAMDFSGLSFSDGVLDGARKLDEHPIHLVWARGIFQALVALDDFALGRKRGSVQRPFHMWCNSVGVPKGRVSGESETVANNPVMRNQRTFRLPSELGGGSRYMEWHLKFGRTPPAPRLHYLDLTSERGVVVVGYIGPHLENTKTN